MASCAVVQFDGTLKLTNDSVSNCSSYVVLDSSDYSLMVSSYSVQPSEIAYVFSWGFGVVLFFWFLGYSIGIAKGVINKV